MRVHVIVLTVLLAAARSALAAPEVVVVVSTDDAFRSAIGDALAPVDMTVIAATDPPPPVVELSLASRAIAERAGAASTVWLIFAASKTTLVAYDRDVDRVLVREVPYTTPLDPAQAAATARMARTMLRALRVTPEIDLPPPHVSEARLVRARAAIASSPPRSHEFAAFAGLGVRVGAPASDAGFDPMLAIAWRPEQLGLALDVHLAPRGHLMTDSFTGRVADDSIAVTGHVPLTSASGLDVVAFGGAAVHAITVDGRLATGSTTSERRFDPAARVGATASYELSSQLALGIVISGDVLLRRQVYAADLAEVLVIPRLQLSVGLLAALRFL